MAKTGAELLAESNAAMAATRSARIAGIEEEMDRVAKSGGCCLERRDPVLMDADFDAMRARGISVIFTAPASEGDVKRWSICWDPDLIPAE